MMTATQSLKPFAAIDSAPARRLGEGRTAQKFDDRSGQCAQEVACLRFACVIGCLVYQIHSVM